MQHGLFLGVDGGGTKTEFVLIDSLGHVRGHHQAGSSYYLQTGFTGLHRVLQEGVMAALAQAQATPGDITYAFFGLPAYGEDSELESVLDNAPFAVLGHRRYTCGNDMVSGWAGSLAAGDGINIVAGTGSIGYGARGGVNARGGGWGEVFSDEGSAYWIAIQGLNAFTRMSDGRLAIGPLHHIFKSHFDIAADLDICGRLLGGGEPPSRDSLAALSQLVLRAAEAGDHEAVRIFDQAGRELAQIVAAIRTKLGYNTDQLVRLSYSGGVFRSGQLILEPLQRHLASLPGLYNLTEPVYNPGIGSALYAARLAGEPLDEAALGNLPTLT